MSLVTLEFLEYLRTLAFEGMDDATEGSFTLRSIELRPAL